MNPIALILIGLGIIMVVVGFKGSQSKLLAAFKGVPAVAKNQPAKASAGAQAFNAAAPVAV